MDTTQTPVPAGDAPDGLDALVDGLAAADPAEAPALAEEVAAALTERLDGPGGAAPGGADR